MRQLFLNILFLLCSIHAISQTDSSAVIMSYEQFMAIVKDHHPVAKQAENQIGLGEAYLMKAKGNFDPVIFGGINQKYFKDEQYYSLIGAGLKIPTWYGISFQSGYDVNAGTQLNARDVLPDEGLWYAGVNVALGKGLIIDQRRAEYKKAKIFVESSIQQKRNMLNELYMQSSVAYWEWFKAYNKMMVYQEAVQNAVDRFEAVKRSAESGDKRSIDTLEANIQLQTRLFSYLDAELEYNNSTSLLEIYLWQDGYVPLEINEKAVPVFSNEVEFKQIDPELVLKIDSIKTNHPELMNARYKIEQSKIDLKLSRENLKPDLNFKYNAITYGADGDLMDNYSVNNYTWGADIKFPLVYRKERGALKVDKLKIENLEADLAFKSEQIDYKVDVTISQWSTTYKQILIWDQTTRDMLTLLESEKTLFDIGESSLFMVNSREKSYINAQLQLVETIAANRKAEIKTIYALGIFYASI